MKKNILDAKTRAHTLERIAQFKAGSPALWGKMNAAQCMCHLADQLRMAFGQIKVAGVPTFMGRMVVKRLVLLGMSAPKGKVSTAPEIDQLTAGTQPTTFEEDRETLLELLEAFFRKSDTYEFQDHPFFGPLTKNQWGKLAWTHLDHHLRQFGV